MLKDREDFYVALIRESTSFNEVCKKANIHPTTGNYITLKKLVKDNNIDISHFKRNGGGNGKRIDTIDYLSNLHPITLYRLKNRLINEGIKEPICENCGCKMWLGKSIPLELHHINGDNTDNRLCNLQLLCPNCHQFTSNFGGKNQNNDIKRK